MATRVRDPDGPHPDLQRLGVKPSMRQYLADIWAKRDFAWTVPMGELRAAHMNTVLGSAWHLLNPLLLAGVFYLVFGVFLGTNRGIDNFIAYLTVGILVFTFTQKSLAAGSRTIIANLPLIQSITFPRIVLPVSSVIGEAIAHVPALLTMLAVALLTGEPLHWTWLLLLPAFGVQCLFNLGIALVSGRLTFHFRDTQQFLPFVTRLWMYLSAIFYSIDRIPEQARPWFEINPAYLIITMHRDILLHQRADREVWMMAAAWAVAAAVLGFFFFRGKESEYGRGY